VPQAGVLRIQPKGPKDPLGGGHDVAPSVSALLIAAGYMHDFTTFLRSFYVLFAVMTAYTVSGIKIWSNIGQKPANCPMSENFPTIAPVAQIPASSALKPV
jgi:hypothetical protein